MLGSVLKSYILRICSPQESAVVWVTLSTRFAGLLKSTILYTGFERTTDQLRSNPCDKVASKSLGNLERLKVGLDYSESSVTSVLFKGD